MLYRLATVLSLAVFGMPTYTVQASETVTPKDGMVVTRSVSLKPGVYVLKKGITVKRNGITLDGAGAVLLGYDNTGTCIRADNVKDLVIKNLTIERFRYGVYVKTGERVTLQGLSVHRTAEIPPGRIFLNIWSPPESEEYGAAAVLWKVKSAVVTGCDFQHQQNGLLLYECANSSISNNNCSFNSGWGISLYETVDSELRGNVVDFCNRIHERGQRSYQAGADATGLLMVMNSSRNKVVGNNFRGGGDGIFVAGYRHPTVKAPCNDNLFEDNDCSLSPNNAIELTFCEGNVFRRNRCNNSNFGFWLGYSWKNTIEDNEINGNRIAGIAIEHGHDSVISANRFRNNRDGVLLWSGGPTDLATSFPNNVSSHDYVIKGNTFTGNRYGVNAITGTGWWGQEPLGSEVFNYGYTITENTFRDNRIGVRFSGVRDSVVKSNRFLANVEEPIQVQRSKAITLDSNEFTEEAPPASP